MMWFVPCLPAVRTGSWHGTEPPPSNNDINNDIFVSSQGTPAGRLATTSLKMKIKHPLDRQCPVTLM